MDLRVHLVGLALVAACTARPLGDDDSGSSGDGGPATTDKPATGDPHPTTSVTTVVPDLTTGPPDPTTTTATNPGTATEPPDPSDPTTATTATNPGTATEPPDPSTSTTTTTTAPPDTSLDDDTGPKPPMSVPVPPGLQSGCPPIPPPNTSVVGETPLGPFNGTRAYFSFVDFDNQIGWLILEVFDDSADLAKNLAEAEQFTQFSTGPGFHAEPSQQFTDQNPFWQGFDDNVWVVVRAGGVESGLSVSVDITGIAGSWDVLDPDNPPRLLGTIGPGLDRFKLEGPFNAVFCEHFGVLVFPE